MRFAQAQSIVQLQIRKHLLNFNLNDKYLRIFQSTFCDTLTWLILVQEESSCPIMKPIPSRSPVSNAI